MADVYAFAPQLARLRDDVLYGDVWRQAELLPRDRSLATCAMLAALGREPELEAHMGKAIDNGVTVDELRGLVVHTAFYAGWPAAMGAGRAAIAALARRGGTQP